MAYSIYWYVPQRVFVIRAEGNISREELAEISEKAIEFVRSGDAPVHWIADTRKINSIPRNLVRIRKIAEIFQEANLGWLFALTNNRFMTFATSVISQLSHINYKSFQEPSDMILSLQQIDPTLVDLPAYFTQEVDV